MTERDNSFDRTAGEQDEANMAECTCGENEACDDCEGETDEEERPVTLNLTRAEAIALHHVTWEQQFEMSGSRETVGVAELIGSVGTQISKEIYAPDMTEWVEEREEEREEMVEEMMEQMGAQMGQGDTPGFGAFQ